jgi:Zn-dependent protease with chaperone function
MLKRPNFSQYAFWLLVLITFALAGLGLRLAGWQYRRGWVQTIWHLCQSGLHNLGQHGAVIWQLVILATIATVLLRAGWSIGQQVWSTRRFMRLFLRLRETPPARLQVLLASHNMSIEDLVYLNVPASHAFCLGFWRPRIWLTARLTDLLTDDELAAVLAHEAYHCRRRDPLRLLISRAIKSAFFFLPLVGDLAKLAELQQETAADQAVIETMGDDLPLLCSLQKLLTQGAAKPPLPRATITPFNVTEARLRRLIYPAQSSLFSWRNSRANYSFSYWRCYFYHAQGGASNIIGSKITTRD